MSPKPRAIYRVARKCAACDGEGVVTGKRPRRLYVPEDGFGLFTGFADTDREPVIASIKELREKGYDPSSEPVTFVEEVPATRKKVRKPR